ncbi:hypothetical protein RB195_011003 [Necator americanus]|uniref:Uncharacterized protein n=1 Tax=Necator americanus TaxID=51031 RepID=A0ABR1D0J4_NECAM
MGYRCTLYPSAPDQRSPAEALPGRRLQTQFGLMLPSRDITNGTRDVKMESQFNRRSVHDAAALRSTTRFLPLLSRITEDGNLLALPVSSHAVLETQPTLFTVEKKYGLNT